MHPALETFFRMQIDISERYHLFDSDDFFVYMTMFAEKVESRQITVEKGGVKMFLNISIHGKESMDLRCEVETKNERKVFNAVGLKTKDEIRRLWVQIVDSTG